MATVARKEALLHWAIDNGVPPTMAGLASASGLHPRTVGRVLAGEGVSDRTCDVLRRLTGLPLAKLFEVRITEPPVMAAEDASPVQEEARAC